MRVQLKNITEKSIQKYNIKTLNTCRDTKMPINANFTTLANTTSPTWKANEQFHIYTKTYDAAGHEWDLVFLSGYVSFDFFIFLPYWWNESLEFSFNDLKWFADTPIQVAPLVTLGTVENLNTDVTTNIGWGITSTQVELIDGTAGSKIIKLKSGISVMGTGTHLTGATYYVTAMGRIHK